MCGAGTTNHCRKSSLLLSHDITSLDMQIQSIRFVATCVGYLLKFIEDFLSSHNPPDSLWRRLLGHLSASSSRLRGIGTLVAAGSQVHQNSLSGVCVICAFLLVLL